MSSGQEWQFHITYWHLAVKNDTNTLVLTSCDGEWLYHIATDQLVVKNGQFHIATHI